MRGRPNYGASWKVIVLVVSAVAVGFVLGVAEGELPFTKNDIAGAEKLDGLTFTDAERDSMQGDLADNLKNYEAVRGVAVANSVPPALVFRARGAATDVALATTSSKQRLRLEKPTHTKRPQNLEEVAFWPVRDLAELVRTKQVTSTELTTMYLNRLKRFGPKLECVVTLTEARAMEAGASGRRGNQEREVPRPAARNSVRRQRSPGREGIPDHVGIGRVQGPNHRRNRDRHSEARRRRCGAGREANLG